MNTSSNPAPDQKSLAQWLSYLETLHPSVIDLGLNRIKLVAERLDIDVSRQTVITVAGTNGKGTTCRFLEQACLVQGKTTGVYSSPHLLDYRERVRINNVNPAARQFCDVFEIIESARDGITLTYFEFGTLAALLLMQQAAVDVIILEVGLGGRLDATNIIDADLAVITTIDLDHQDWLGDTREAIAREKAGIMRQGGRAVIGELSPPASLTDVVSELAVTARWAGQDFQTFTENETWQWQGFHSTISELPVPRIPAQNIATSLAALEMLGWLPDSATVQALVARVNLPGRLETIATQPWVVVDVGHNPQAMAALRKWLHQQQFHQLRLVVGMLKDKSIRATLTELAGLNAHWYLGTTQGPRGAAASVLQENLDNADQNQSNCYTDVEQAYLNALNDAQDDDIIVVFGSFLTVADVMRASSTTSQ
ncbi:bifunctional tetrahydrofolate synthase/dihydrofolate synthase [Salinimonas chungwhensis]|uniref:bifunctional tetrahydrofolate synthase/dihydrofolate synthase n=1 Tax=Salinimonas chungwhensis TaxID=265425 RepID=UPI00035E3880|nr:bifunctional tetrahydrofolate synthase/dihydrofolate synthase [Salinimonas chungwhensis]